MCHDRRTPDPNPTYEELMERVTELQQKLAAKDKVIQRLLNRNPHAHA